MPVTIEDVEAEVDGRREDARWEGVGTIPIIHETGKCQSLKFEALPTKIGT